MLLFRYSQACFRFGLRSFYRKIYLNNDDKIKKNKPVILATNHPNSFIDDITIGSFFWRDSNYLARGDVFSSKLNRYLLRQYKMYPIYRASDNPKDVKKNNETVETTTDLLRDNQMIIMHPEGICVHEKRIRKMRKGIARIAFSAENASDFKLGVEVIPIALNYTNSPKCREELIIEVGDPIKVSKFKELYEENPNKAMAILNEEIYAGLRKHAIHIENKEDDEFVEQMLIIERNNNKSFNTIPFITRNSERFQIDKDLVEKVNNLRNNSPEKLSELKEKANSYFKDLKKNNIKDRFFMKKEKAFALKVILMTLGLPFFLLGYAFNYPYVKGGWALANKVVRTVEFYASVCVAGSFAISLIYLPIMLILASVFFGYIGAISVFTLLGLGYFSVLYRDKYLVLKDYIKFISFKRSNKETFNNIKIKREELVKDLN